MHFFKKLFVVKSQDMKLEAFFILPKIRNFTSRIIIEIEQLSCKIIYSFFIQKSLDSGRTAIWTFLQGGERPKAYIMGFFLAFVYTHSFGLLPTLVYINWRVFEKWAQMYLRLPENIRSLLRRIEQVIVLLL